MQIKVVLTYKVEDLYGIFDCCGFSDLSGVVVEVAFFLSECLICPSKHKLPTKRFRQHTAIP